MERAFPKQWKGPLHMWKSLLKRHHKWIGCSWWSKETLLQKRNKVVLRKALMQKNKQIWWSTTNDEVRKEVTNIEKPINNSHAANKWKRTKQVQTYGITTNWWW
jgi:hypothetical protein